MRTEYFVSRQLVNRCFMYEHIPDLPDGAEMQFVKDALKIVSPDDLSCIPWFVPDEISKFTEDLICRAGWDKLHRTMRDRSEWAYLNFENQGIYAILIYCLRAVALTGRERTLVELWAYLFRATMGPITRRKPVFHCLGTLVVSDEVSKCALIVSDLFRKRCLKEQAIHLIQFRTVIKADVEYLIEKMSCALVVEMARMNSKAFMSRVNIADGGRSGEIIFGGEPVAYLQDPSRHEVQEPYRRDSYSNLLVVDELPCWEVPTWNWDIKSAVW